MDVLFLRDIRYLKVSSHPAVLGPGRAAGVGLKGWTEIDFIIAGQRESFQRTGGVGALAHIGQSYGVAAIGVAGDNYAAKHQTLVNEPTVGVCNPGKGCGSGEPCASVFDMVVHIIGCNAVSDSSVVICGDSAEPERHLTSLAFQCKQCIAAFNCAMILHSNAADIDLRAGVLCSHMVNQTLTVLWSIVNGGIQVFNRTSINPEQGCFQIVDGVSLSIQRYALSKTVCYRGIVTGAVVGDALLVGVDVIHQPDGGDAVIPSGGLTTGEAPTPPQKLHWEVLM